MFDLLGYNMSVVALYVQVCPEKEFDFLLVMSDIVDDHFEKLIDTAAKSMTFDYFRSLPDSFIKFDEILCTVLF